MDGAKPYFYLKGKSTNKATDEITFSSAPKKSYIDSNLGPKFVQWFEKLFYQPPDPEVDAWLPDRLEYQFAVSAPKGDSEKVLRAEEYYHGRPDWYNFDIDPTSKGLSSGASTSNVKSTITRTFLPTQVIFGGMPNTRSWTFEDRRTNIGDSKPDTTDIAINLLAEFCLGV